MRAWLFCAAASVTTPAFAAFAPATPSDFQATDSIETFPGPNQTPGQMGSSESFGDLTVTSNNAQLFRYNYGNFGPHGGSGDPALFDSLAGTTGSDITLSWSTPMKRVGWLMTGGNARTSWRVDVFDSEGDLFGSAFYQWNVILGYPNDPPLFIGFLATEGISSVRVVELQGNFQYTGFDDVRFAPIPSPSVIALLGASLPLLLRRRR